MLIVQIGGMDSFARGLQIADTVLADPRRAELRFGRYRSFDAGDGKRFENGELSLADLRDIAAANGKPQWASSLSQQEPQE